MELSQEMHLRFYRSMFRIRRFEETVVEMSQAGHIPGIVHVYIGEEPVAVGVCEALNPDDYISGTHRGHGHCLAKGMQAHRMMAELFAKATGYNRGKGGSMHIASLADGVLGCNGIVAGGVGLATGAGFSARQRGSGQVSVAFFGDGALNRGSLHEAMNLAAVWKLPVLFVCEDNGWAISMSSERSVAIDDVSVRAEGYGMPGVSVDGNDVTAVYQAAREAVERARAGEGPTFLICRTSRIRGHEEGDPQAYRDPEDLKNALAGDPVARYREHLLKEGLVTQEELEEIEAEVNEEVEEAVAFAKESPAPTLASALEDVYEERVQ
ncbi:MAG: thiamine pyrophosphate-dependent dehydrogenase E1 component subunit alpha [Anaerolineae bacterium]|jgi:TPP-dependent pyruvate/acetoin dehydrogenase alpha subunit